MPSVSQLPQTQDRSRAPSIQNSSRNSFVADSCVPRSFTREQTIDILERRQEAAVLRHLRQLNSLDPCWCVGAVGAVGAVGPSLAQYHSSRPQDPFMLSEFGALSNAQIAEVMATEQKILESRLQRSIYGRRSI
ncbi:hypothetical protein JCM33374_g6111 [Metschnikowia sp. JCM 33374]|nr:hypothetical protein JCM33374_g6111 [Metschnikowia sp. JCM 33374]